MAKAKSGDDTIRFGCSSCGAKLRVSVALAGRYTNCPKCKNRAAVPHSQKEADDDARNLTIQEMAYEVPERCMKCGKKMKKGAVVCVNCGFDYKEGKQLTTEDFSVQPGEKRRGGPAMIAMIVEIFALFIDVGLFIFRATMESKNWWELGLYLGAKFYLICCIPAHFWQWWNYKDLPVRDHPLVKEEDRAEREEVAMPFGYISPLVFFFCMATGLGIAFFIWSRDENGKLVIPFMGGGQQ